MGPGAEAEKSPRKSWKSGMGRERGKLRACDGKSMSRTRRDDIFLDIYFRPCIKIEFFAKTVSLFFVSTICVFFLGVFSVVWFF